MNSKSFQTSLIFLLLGLSAGGMFAAEAIAAPPSAQPGVAVLYVDTDRVMGTINDKIYGQFLEHINHSVEGLYAELIQGRGFEGRDFQTFWQGYGTNGSAAVVLSDFQRGTNSLRLEMENGVAGARQNHIYLQAGFNYSGSVWLKIESGFPKMQLTARDAQGRAVATVPLNFSGSGWQEAAFAFSNSVTDANASVEIEGQGSGSVLVDYVSMMRADLRTNGMLRPDLYQALDDLHPPFIRWPGGSFASTYRWEDGIGPLASRVYHPNVIWGGYSDYYSFGTEEFMELCRRLGSEPLVVLAATNTDPASVQYAMNWVHYLNDPATTEWGQRRAANGHPAPYDVKYFQIDNEPMNFNLTPERYAEIVNVYGRELRKIAPRAKIVACGQKRSNDMEWSEKLVDIAGENFDVLGCHNYEYENDNFETGVRRIKDYLVKLKDYIHASGHPQIQMAVLEWSLCHTYDWRAGLHAAGMLMAYEELSPDLAMTCPALLMRNTTDDPDWHAWIYHDNSRWFPGAGYVVEKLFRAHYAEKYLASTTGTFRDLPNRARFFDDISQMKPEAWTPGTVDAIATGSADGRRIVIKMANYAGQTNTVLTRLRGASAPGNGTVKIYRIAAALTAEASLDHPDAIQPEETSQRLAGDLAIDLAPYTVAVAEIGPE